MRIQLLFLTSALFATELFANERDDAAFFKSHFVQQKEWDRAHRRMERRGEVFYEEALRSRGIVIVDVERFRDMIPSAATAEAIKQLKSHAAEIVVQGYGKESLSEIVDFFQTPTGQSMLTIAKTNRLFERLHRQSPKDGPVERWKTYLSIDEFAQYNAFTSTRAGQDFVQRTWAVRRALHYEIHGRSDWAELPLKWSYLIEIVEADGILQFPNRVTRQSFLRELSATN